MDTGNSRVTFSRLGEFGQFGNQLFQISGTIGIAASLGLEVTLPAWRYRHHFPALPESYFSREQNSGAIIDAAYLCYQRLGYDACLYMQDPTLWANCEQRVLTYLTPSLSVFDRVEGPALDALRLISDESRTCIALHVRRGDYINSSSHVVLPMDYYRRALSIVGPGEIIVFTDDREWCLRNFEWCLPRVVVSSPSAIIDFVLMTQCDRHVIANSTFSWWASYLARSDRVVMPDSWFTASEPRRLELSSRLRFRQSIQVGYDEDDTDGRVDGRGADVSSTRRGQRGAVKRLAFLEAALEELILAVRREGS
ncbi:alpha-1,2-fucosyltransferase [Kribbella sp. NPDC051587]|uniref:alpha-1,2-fucosyltransferase n=1 Tax=Kribbella sp. NPDC051587 TaxID=3364119 RepID=UPI0037AFF1DE